MNETEIYRRDGYVALEGMFPPEVVRAFYNQMQADLHAAGRPLQSFTARGPLLRRDALEVYASQYAPMLTFLWGLTPRMRHATGYDLLPTYAYFRAYRQGDVCRVHTARHACEHSLSLTMTYCDDRPWALSVATQRTEPGAGVADDFDEQPYGSVAIQPGDGVADQGAHHRHGRTDPNPNSWSAHLFLHWVDRNGPYKEHAFDRVALQQAQQRHV